MVFEIRFDKTKAVFSRLTSIDSKWFGIIVSVTKFFYSAKVYLVFTAFSRISIGKISVLFIWIEPLSI